VSRSTARRASVAVILSAAVMLAVSGCAAGFNATTTEPYSPADGVMGISGNVRVLNALVVVPVGGSTGVISMTVANDAHRVERIISLTSNGGTVDWSGPRVIPAGDAIRLGANTVPSATLTGLRVQPGDAVRLRIGFARTAPISIDTVVLPASGPYASYTAPPVPVPSVSTSESPTESASPSAT
jgi:hypothetical protein